MQRVLVFLLFLPFVVNAQCEFSLGPDTGFCVWEDIIIYAPEDAVVFEWHDGSTEEFYVVSNPETVELEAGFAGDNLIINGDFENGDEDFESDYILGTGGSWGLLSDAGTYAVSTDPSLTHSNFAACTDHTSGSGEMMIVNGATATNTSVWTQEITIEPLTYYQFATWITSVVSANPATLQFSINGQNLGDPFSPSSLSCDWQLFAEEWYSENNTVAVISIVNQNTVEGGNDFALDDISFSPLCFSTDAIIVNQGTAEDVNLGPDTTVCIQSSYQLNASQNSADYTWQDNSTSASLEIIESGWYWVDVDVNGCVKSDSVYIQVMDCSVQLTMPNVITPNADGRNDSFVPVYMEGVTEISYFIYNRWGKLIFDSAKQGRIWKADDEPDGSYFWLANFLGVDGNQYQESGYVTVIR